MTTITNSALAAPTNSRGVGVRGLRDQAELEAFLDGIMNANMRDQHVAGATVAVVKDGSLFFAKGYGYADVGRRTRIDPYRKIADILRMKEATVRQLVTRARDHVSGQPRASASSADQRRFLSVMSAACRMGDLTRLERLLVADIGSKAERSGRSVSVGPRSFNEARLRRRSPARPSSAGSSWARQGKEKSL
jgi:hypothetical protein